MEWLITLACVICFLVILAGIAYIFRERALRELTGPMVSPYKEIFNQHLKQRKKAR